MSPLNYLDLVKKEDLTVAYLWTHFAGFVLPPDASEGQRQDMRSAFYAGFFECFRVMNDVSERLPEAEAGETLSRINDEGIAFFNAFMEKHGPKR